MARVRVEIPRVGLVMEKARVMRWLKAVGDEIAPGEPLVEVETEKSLVEIEASVGGRLVEILVEPDTEVEVGAPLAWLEDGRPEAAAAPSAAGAEGARAPEAPAQAAPVAARAGDSAGGTERPRASPAARKRAAELDVDLALVRGGGPGGRIQIEDVERAASEGSRASGAIEGARRSGAAVGPRASGAAEGPRASGAAVSAGAERAAEGVQPLSPMRRAIARTATRGNATVPQFDVGRAVDWSAIESLGARGAGRRPSLTDYLLKAAARTLVELPALNAVFVGDPDSPAAGLRAASGAHIGLVVSVPGGMRVPVLHGVERLTLAEVAERRADAVERARAGRLRQEESTGATFTISNLGAGGPDRFTALLGPGESGILAVGRRREVALVRDGAVAVRPVSELTLTVDHRVADGQLAAEFLARLVEILESWSASHEAADH